MFYILLVDNIVFVTFIFLDQIRQEYYDDGLNIILIWFQIVYIC